MNSIILTGNLVADPETSTTQSGIAVCRFRLAVRRAIKGADGVDVDFFQIVAWRKTAELCEKYLSKGSKVGITGEIHNRSYQNADGQNRTVTEITAGDVEFLTPKTADGKANGAAKGTIDDLPEADEDDGQLPF